MRDGERKKEKEEKKGRKEEGEEGEEKTRLRQRTCLSTLRWGGVWGGGG